MKKTSVLMLAVKWKIKHKTVEQYPDLKKITIKVEKVVIGWKKEGICIGCPLGCCMISVEWKEKR